MILLQAGEGGNTDDGKVFALRPPSLVWYLEVVQMGELVDTLGNKSPGQLIKSEDWNALVAAVEGVETRLQQNIDNLSSSVDQRFQTVNTTLGNLETRLSTLEEELTSLRAVVTPLLAEYYRVTMETSRVSFAIGELAEITARVTDLQGNPLELSSPADRPWVDFVANWGQLRPVLGFESRGGVGDRTISVQTNAEGIARVRLRAEHVEGLATEVEDEMSAALTTHMAANGPTVAMSMLQSATPMEARQSGAFDIITAEYDRSDAANVRSYVDSYYIKNSALVAGKLLPTFTHRWRDYRSTVLAFAKRDSDPRTPDHSRGISSIQMTFRDWIGPWIVLDYLDVNVAVVDSVKDRIRPKVTKDYAASINLLKEEVQDFLRGKGAIGKQRDYLILEQAFETLDVTDPPEFFNDLSASFQNAIKFQQTAQITEFMSFGVTDENIGFQAFTDAAARNEGAVAGFRDQVAQVAQGVEEAQTQVSNVQKDVGSLDGRLSAAIEEGGTLSNINARVDDLDTKVRNFEALNVADVKNQLDLLSGMRTRLESVESVVIGSR